MGIMLNLPSSDTALGLVSRQMRNISLDYSFVALPIHNSVR
jgi:hypothetical protein